MLETTSGPSHFNISIHPPCGGRDPGSWRIAAKTPDFNPPALWGAGPCSFSSSGSIAGFQSTRPVGGGTMFALCPLLFIHISIHPPCGGRDSRCPPRTASSSISIHPPCGGRDVCVQISEVVVAISIHPPCGGRDRKDYGVNDYFGGFQSTRPVGGGTANALVFFVAEIFQSTRPVGGGTSSSIVLSPDYLYFNPPALWGAGLHPDALTDAPFPFQSTRPVGGGT